MSVRSFGRASYFDEYRSNNIFNIGNNSLSLNLNMNRSYISPRNVSELNFKNLNTSEDKQNMNGIPTILKKIVDWEKKKDEDQEAKEESNKENNNIKNNLNTLFKLKIEEDIKLIRNKTESFTELYDGVCNFLIFLRNATPYITKDKNYIDAFREIKLEHFLNVFINIPYLVLELIIYQVM